MVSELVAVKGLAMHFGGVAALQGINFQLAQRELCCVIGPNGAGKSTFFKCLTGQLQPTEGSIHFDGRPLRNLDSYEIARLGIGIKTQVPSVFNGLSVADNIRMALRRHLRGGALEQRLSEISTEMGINEILTLRVDTLAHGQRQLVELAMVIAPSPRLILLDEPAAGLTHQESGHLTTLIRRLSERCALIVVEHDMAFIRSIASRIVVFNRGMVLRDGAADDVLADETVKNVYLGKQGA